MWFMLQCEYEYWPFCFSTASISQLFGRMPALPWILNAQTPCDDPVCGACPSHMVFMQFQWLIHCGANTGQQGIEADWRFFVFISFFVAQHFVRGALYSAASRCAWTEMSEILVASVFAPRQQRELCTIHPNHTHTHTRTGRYLCLILAHRCSQTVTSPQGATAVDTQ